MPDLTRHTRDLSLELYGSQNAKTNLYRARLILAGGTIGRIVRDAKAVATAAAVRRFHELLSETPSAADGLTDHLDFVVRQAEQRGHIRGLHEAADDLRRGALGLDHNECADTLEARADQVRGV